MANQVENSKEFPLTSCHGLSITYERLRKHPFFDDFVPFRSSTSMDCALSPVSDDAQSNVQDMKAENDCNFVEMNDTNEKVIYGKGYGFYSFPAVRVPTLRELCQRAVAKASILAANAIAMNGGIRPEDPWIQVDFTRECRYSLSFL